MNYSAARQNMVDAQLSPNGIYEPRLLEVMGLVPRERFVPEALQDRAYLDEDVELGQGRVLMEPMIIGRMVQVLDPQPDEVVLDVAGTSGYSAAVLSPFVQTVIALDNQGERLAHTAEILRELDLTNIADVSGDLEHGCEQHAPFDMILINGAVADIPESLVAQLKPETGRMVCVHRPAGQRSGQLLVIRPTGREGEYSTYPLFNACVPYAQEFAPKEEFSF